MAKYDIENKGDWQQDFFRDDARRKIKELSVKYRVPRGHLVHALEYCRFLKRSWAGYDVDINSHYIRLDDEEFREPPLPQTSSETDEPIAELSELMEEYDITESEFTEYFLAADVEPEYIAEELGVPLSAAREICDLVERVQILSSMQVNVVEQPVQKREQHIDTVATVRRLKNPPRAEIQVDTDIIYNSRYIIKTDGDGLKKEIDEFVERLRLINQRKSLTFRIVMFMELAKILERDYDTKISRRTVTYYRNKFRDTPKFYARNRMLKFEA